MRKEKLNQEKDALIFLLFNSKTKKYVVNPRLYNYLKNQKKKLNY